MSYEGVESKGGSESANIKRNNYTKGGEDCNFMEMTIFIRFCYNNFSDF